MNTVKKMGIPYYLWGTIFVIIPVIMVCYYAFTDPEGSFSLAQFQRIFEWGTLRVIGRSMLTALITTLICFLLGYPMAYFLSRTGLKYRGVAMALIIIPMWMNFLLRTYSWVTILSRNGLLNIFFRRISLPPTDILYSWPAVYIGMVYNFLPFMVLPIYTVLEKMDKGLIEAAADLGANKWQTFFRLVLPLSREGVISGITMVFVPVMSTFEITSLLGGSKINLVGNIISQQFTVTGNWHYGSAMAVILMVFLLISLLIDRDPADKRQPKPRKEAGRGRI